MDKDHKPGAEREPEQIDLWLREQLRAIEQEETPERLLLLAQQLQGLLRANRK